MSGARSTSIGASRASSGSETEPPAHPPLPEAHSPPQHNQRAIFPPVASQKGFKYYLLTKKAVDGDPRICCGWR